MLFILRTECCVLLLIAFAEWGSCLCSCNAHMNPERQVLFFSNEASGSEGVGGCGVMGSIQGGLTLQLEWDRTTYLFSVLGSSLVKWEGHVTHLAAIYVLGMQQKAHHSVPGTC